MNVIANPGLDPRRLVRLMNAAVESCALDLAELTVLTEAASGAYLVTPVLAALAGARVLALACANPYATAEEIRDRTMELAGLAGVSDRIRLIYDKSPGFVGAADIVTNSGQVRPIDAAMISHMKPSAVIPLMYESWEFRASDVDLQACRARGIAVAGTNERHPDVGMFSYLGTMAVKQLHDAGIAVYGSRVVLLCDNPFGPFIVSSLRNAGAEVIDSSRLTADLLTAPCDAVLLALHPKPDAAAEGPGQSDAAAEGPGQSDAATGGSGQSDTAAEGPGQSNTVLGAAEIELLADLAPGTALVQYWGDVDRAALAAASVPVWPPKPPGAGHMGVLPSAVGPEPIVRLQAGSLKVGELLARGLDKASPADLELVQPL
jgi:hypothetical protein